METIKKEFELSLELIKKEAHEKLKELFHQYKNAKNWKVSFEYDWCVNASSSINEDNDGWYDKMINDSKQELDAEEAKR